MNKLIGITGRSGSGKDEIGKIIQKLAPHYINKKFADKLKDIVCLLIGCTREDLENEEFKNKELGEEWWKYQQYDKTMDEWRNTSKKFYSKLNHVKHADFRIIKITPRILLQLLGTECGREIIHPNIWINSTFVDYVSEKDLNTQYAKAYPDNMLPLNNAWYITDCRFPNEANAIRDRGGFIINAVRTCQECSFTHVHTPECSQYAKSQHTSETALNGYPHIKYMITNNSSLEYLEQEVKEILIKEGIL